MNDKIILDIIDMNESGQGVAKDDSMVYFVNKAVIGDKVECEIQLRKKNYTVANAIRLLSPSIQRKSEYIDVVEMPYGLSLQALQYQYQLNYKEEKLFKTIDKIAGIPIEKKNHIIGLEGETRYRNKGVFPIRYANGKIQIGAFERASHRIIDEMDNFAMPESYALILSEIKRLAKEHKISAYDESKHKGCLKFITIRSNSSKEHLIILNLHEDELLDGKKAEPFVQDLVDNLEKHGVTISGIVKSVNSAKSNFAGNGKVSLLHGKDYIYNNIEEVKFKLGVHSFFQVSNEGVEKLYQEVYRMASSIAFSSVWDIYCGLGSIGLYLSKKLLSQDENVSIDLNGLEYVEEAIGLAKENASLNEIENTYFEAGKAEILLKQWVDKFDKPDLIILDPPRKGVDKKALDAVIKTGVQNIIYVSCKPSTLARDLSILHEAGYDCKEMTPVDIFPMTMHVECIVLLQREI